MGRSGGKDDIEREKVGDNRGRKEKALEMQ